MSQNYTIPLDRDLTKKEPYEIEDENLAEVRVQIPTGEIVSNSSYKVSLTLSPDAMIGFGTELIRRGLQLKSAGEESYDYSVEHLEGIYSQEPCQKLGIYLTPKSCDLIILAENYGKVEDILTHINDEDT